MYLNQAKCSNWANELISISYDDFNDIYCNLFYHEYKASVVIIKVHFIARNIQRVYRKLFDCIHSEVTKNWKMNQIIRIN